MKNSFKSLMMLAMLFVGSQSFAMSRLLNSLRIKVAPRATALRALCKQAFAHNPLRINFSRSLMAQRWNNSMSARFTPAQKQTPNFSRARMALAGSIGATAAGLALYPQKAKADSDKVEDDEREINTTFGHLDSLVNLIQIEKDTEKEIDRLVSEASFLSHYLSHLEKIDAYIYSSNQKVPLAREHIKEQRLWVSVRTNQILKEREAHTKTLKKLQQMRQQQYENVLNTFE